AAQGMSRHSVDAVIAAADALGVSYDDVAAVPNGEVYARLFPGRGEHHSVYAQPDWDEVHRELAKVGVTLKLSHGEGGVKAWKQHGVRRPVVGRRILSVSGSPAAGGAGC